MQIFLAIVTVALLLLAAYIVICNWVAIYISYRNKRRNIDRYVSGVPVVPQICVLIAALVARWVQVIQIPSWVFWLIALADTTLFMLLYLPIFLFLRNRDKQT